MLIRMGACLVASTVGLALCGNPASADDPPTNCRDGLGCFTRVQKPRVPDAVRDRPAAVSRPPFTGVAGEAGPDGPIVTPEQAAERAVAFLPLRGPDIGIAPGSDGRGLVGLPVWLWTEQGPETWGPLVQTTAVTGLAVLVRAQATSISWDFGDGTSITCDGPGTPYDASYGNAESPDCGYRYPRSSRSRPGGVYTITGTTRWEVTWQIVGTAATGLIVTTAGSEVDVRIDEMQVLTR